MATDPTSVAQAERVLDEERLSALLEHRTRWPQQFLMFTWAAFIANIANGRGLPRMQSVALMVLLVCFNLAIRQMFVLLANWAQAPARRRLHFSAAICLVDGLIVGSPCWLFVKPSDADLLILFLFPAGMVTTAAISTAGWSGTFLCYSWTLMPACAFMLWPTRGQTGEWVRVALACAWVVHWIMLKDINLNLGALFRRSVEANTELQRALKLADEASRAKTRFLASASHDLRQPLYTLSLFCGALSMRNLDVQAKEMVGDMDLAVRGLSEQLDSLLDISKLDAGTIECKPCEIDLSIFLERLRHEFEPRTQNRGLEMLVACPAGLIVRTDELLFERVLRNLLDNAVKYTNQGAITLRAALEGPHVQVTLTDTGVGIPPEEQGRVFEEFYQLHNPERDRTQGLGLGLSIVQRLSQLLGIDLRLRSQPGVGTEVKLQWPAVLHTELLVPASSDRSIALPQVAGLRVLVVDDERAVRKGLQALLAAWGCHVTLSSGTDEAEACARANPPDVLICDLRLRGSDSGLETIRRLRELYPQQAAIVVTGDTAPDRLREASAAKVKLLHKPVSPEVLRCELANVRNAQMQS